MLKFKKILLFMLLVILCTVSTDAKDADSYFCFSASDFSMASSDEGIFITAVPSQNIATVQYGNRTLKAGDALTVDALGSLTLQADCVTQQAAEVEYCTVADGKITGVKSLKMSIRPKKNDPPIAKDSTIETYKNISNSGTLDATDPEGKPLTYQLAEAPKRGEVEIFEDGIFTYTPKKNKVGSDKFTFTVTDDAGNTSDPATVRIEILKPTDSRTYSDLANDSDQVAAMWLREQGIYTGPTIGEHLCFEPMRPVSRGDFLVMAMHLVKANDTLVAQTSGFLDEPETPVWMQPYISTALSNGMVVGTSTEEGVIFRPAEAMTKAEAVVLLQNILDLPESIDSPVFASDEHETTVPVWAQSAFKSLSHAGIHVDLTNSDEPLTNLSAAHLLYDVNTMLQSSDVATFHWIY